jgi:hypothetical protein
MVESSADLLPTSEEFDEKWANPPARQDPKKSDSEWSEKVSPSDILAVHVTNTFPSEGKIRSHIGWALHRGEIEGASQRDTVHFSLNGTVQYSVQTATGGIGQWDTRKFAILSPLTGFKRGSISNIREDDTWIKGDFDIPKGSTVLVDFSEINGLIQSGLINSSELKDLGLSTYSHFYDCETKAALKNTQQEFIFIRGGIRYVITNISHANLRNKVADYIREMGYRPFEMVQHGWQRCGINFDSPLRTQYGLKFGTLHSDHIDSGLEHKHLVLNDNWSGVNFDDFLNLIRLREKDPVAFENRESGNYRSFVKRFVGNCLRYLTEYFGSINDPGFKSERAAEVVNSNTRISLIRFKVRLEGILNSTSLTNAEKDQINSVIDLMNLELGSQPSNINVFESFAVPIKHRILNYRSGDYFKDLLDEIDRLAIIVSKLNIEEFSGARKVVDALIAKLEEKRKNALNKSALAELDEIWRRLLVILLKLEG